MHLVSRPAFFGLPENSIPIQPSILFLFFFKLRECGREGPLNILDRGFYFVTVASPKRGEKKKNIIPRLSFFQLFGFDNDILYERCVIHGS